MKKYWFDKKVLILGFSRSGISAAKYLNSKGAECYITEIKPDGDKEKIKEIETLGIKVEFGGHSKEFIEGSYIAITSPGIPPKSEIFKKLKEQDIPVISEIELAYTETQTPFFAITGTNGKTTTTTLASHILSTEYKAPVCGNIGIPPTGLISEENDYLVCEVSSFQLEFSPTFCPQIYAFLNFTPDHIDWHDGLENYFKAKIRPLNHKPAFAIFNATDPKLVEYTETYTGEKFFFGKEFSPNCSYVKDDAIYFKRNNIEEKIIDLKDVPIVGEHNYQNIEAALIGAKIIGISNENINSAIKSFKAVEHRLEYTAEYGGKTFYNDSKATNPEASIVAIRSFEGKSVTLIAGGRDKNTDLTEFCNDVKKYIKTVILIGEATQRFEEELIKNGFSDIIKKDSMEAAIDTATELQNEVVLLSPACASFDMFNSYEHRGEVFKEYVLSKVK
ncbi:UDP-N-acetylmuramoyl-L-alanine--D-glutamate ligase [bacterium]|nr:UDP-N-acetylmuramoyl-L-alanine--D-glutamate ligase [bacterium]